MTKKDYRIRAEIESLSDETKKALMSEMCRFGELQYRKGVQQGVEFAENGFKYLDKKGVEKRKYYTSKDAYKFRHYHTKKIKNGRPVYYHESPDPRGLSVYGKTKCQKWNQKFRMSCELDNTPYLRHLFNIIPDKGKVYTN